MLAKDARVDQGEDVVVTLGGQGGCGRGRSRRCSRRRTVRNARRQADPRRGSGRRGLLEYLPQLRRRSRRRYWRRRVWPSSTVTECVRRRGRRSSVNGMRWSWTQPAKASPADRQRALWGEVVAAGNDPRTSPRESSKTSTPTLTCEVDGHGGSAVCPRGCRPVTVIDDDGQRRPDCPRGDGFRTARDSGGDSGAPVSPLTTTDTGCALV